MIAKRESFKNLPIPKENITVEVNKKFSSSEMDVIRKGIIPEQMENKWFIFAEENTIYFHRSWTGHCIFFAKFIEDKDGFVINKLTINRNPKQYSIEDTEWAIERFFLLIDIYFFDR